MTNKTLTGTQEHALRLVRDGYTYDEMAAELDMTASGAKYHVRRLCAIFGVDSKRQLIRVAAERNAA